MIPGNADHNGITRIRQACSSCRRKKVRCSGERPTCAFCRRLDQACLYSDDSPSRSTQPYQQPVAEAHLASRIATLESQLKRLSDATFRFNDTTVAQSSASQTGLASDTSTLELGPQPSSVPPSSTSFPLLPQFPLDVLRSLVDFFFLNLHNQPYSLFHEASFRLRLQADLISNALVYSFLALSLRFAQDPYFNGHEADVAHAYAAESWKLIQQQWMDANEDGQIQMAQALVLLSLLDLSESRRQHSVIKTAVAVRLCQDLKLTNEPDPFLSPTEQEERRRVFWSVYILDQLMSCNQGRPASFPENRCQVQLPCEELDYRQGKLTKTSRLTSHHSDDGPSPFALLILMVSTFGYCSKYMFDQSLQTRDLDSSIPTSQLAIAIQNLSWFELNFDICDGLERTIANHYMCDGVIDQQRAGHFVLAHAFFHLSHCLLNHPFLLLRQARISSAKCPANFLKRSFATCSEHAVALTMLQKEIQNVGSILWTPLFGFISVVAGTVHILFSRSLSGHPISSSTSTDLISTTFDYLQRLKAFWPEAELMATSLQNLQAESTRYRKLLQPPFRLEGEEQPLLLSDLDILAKFLDYSWATTCVIVPNQRRTEVPEDRNQEMEGAVSGGNEAEGRIPFAPRSMDRGLSRPYPRDSFQPSSGSSNPTYEVIDTGDDNTVPSLSSGNTAQSAPEVEYMVGVAVPSSSSNIQSTTGQPQRRLSSLAQFLMSKSTESARPPSSGN